MSPSFSTRSTSSPVSSRTSLKAAASGVSSPFGWPFGRPRTRSPAADRLTGTTTATSPPRSTTPPAEKSVDVSLERFGLMDDQLAAALGDDPRTLQYRQEAARGFPRRARELRQLGLSGGDQYVAVTGALGARGLDQLREHGRDAALDRPER